MATCFIFVPLSVVYFTNLYLLMCTGKVCNLFQKQVGLFPCEIVKYNSIKFELTCNIAKVFKHFSFYVFRVTYSVIIPLSNTNYYKMVVSKHLTHFCFPIKLVLHQHLNLHVILKIQTTLEKIISNCNRTLFSDYFDQSLTKLIHQI